MTGSSRIKEGKSEMDFKKIAIIGAGAVGSYML
jgi:hypothetical protein